MDILDLYIELELSRNASFDEIKESFRKLAKIYHPDNKESGNHYKFINIKKSYDILSDPI